jgi:tRNA (mo5U34)-methyltransferase
MNTHDAPREKLLQEVERHEWAHSIDLGNGVVTKGRFGPPNVYVMKAFDQIDFDQKKVLDIGCWDGLWSFEAEKRGAAEVYATDDVSQSGVTRKGGGGKPTFLLGT